MILRSPEKEEDVRALLTNLEIVVAAHATDAVPQGNGNAASASGKHDLTSETIAAVDIAHAVSIADHMYVVWKTTLHLSRPRVRLQRPAIYFTANLTPRPEAVSASRHHEGKDYLKPFEPLPRNVLEPLNFDPSMRGSKIYLSEDRITKVAPASAARTHDDIKPLRGASKRAFPIVPAMFTKIRYNALPNAVVASLHLETSNVIVGTVKVNDVRLKVDDAQVENLCEVDWPKETHAGDETVLLYRLTLATESAAAGPSILSVEIDAAAVLDQGSQSELGIRWQAQVDLAQTSAKPIYKWSRPLSAPMLQPSQASSRPTSTDASQAYSPSESGITFNFKAAPIAIRNQDFRLDVQCINRSSRARRFALVVLQPTKKSHTKSQEQSNPSEDTDLIAHILNAPPLERHKAPDVLDLNPDVRIGPLPPGACYETHMEFRAVATGVLDLGVLRIVDLDTRQTIDVMELPEVIALEAEVEAAQEKA